MSFGIDLGLSGGSSRSVQDPARVWGTQAPYLRNLYNNAQHVAMDQYGGGQLPNITSASQQLSQGLISQANQGSPWLSNQIQALGQDIGQFFNQQILPGIANEAGGYGSYGGARQSLAEGLAGQDALRQFTTGATNLRQADYTNGPARAAQLYNLGMAPYSAQFQPLL